MTLRQALEPFGLYLRGVARLTAEEIDEYGFDPDRGEIALVGNIGSSYWPHFSTSAEYNDLDDDPLDRWSRRVAQDLADELGLTPVFPFDGPPYYPFQRWAARAEALPQSPIGRAFAAGASSFPHAGGSSSHAPPRSTRPSD